jgi:hypothetical protein
MGIGGLGLAEWVAAPNPLPPTPGGIRLIFIKKSKSYGAEIFLCSETLWFFFKKAYFPLGMVGDVG